MQVLAPLRRAQQAVARSLGVFISDSGRGLLEVSHNSLAFLGLVVFAALVFAAGREDVRHQAETIALQWLQSRQEARSLDAGDVLPGVADGDAVQRATAIDPSKLTREQALVARWIARKYKVAQEPVGRLVHEAWMMGSRAGIEPTLILAIVAVESSFNPFAQSAMGAQGLMQVMTRVHDEKYEAFGGTHAAFDPVSNLRVGVQVLKECIARAGGVQEGLRRYVGASAMDDDGGYASRVLAEQARLRDAAMGKVVPLVANAPAANSSQAPSNDAGTTVPVDRPVGKPAASPVPPDKASRESEQLALLR